jgi:glycosyltransferase involved in cell wall biosynthesis
VNRALSVSIVTPSLNQAAFLPQALRSVKDQKYGKLEHLIIDGGSRDGTIEILRRYSGLDHYRHLHWISEPDHGQSDALNKGFSQARGDIIGWLNSDDRYRSGCLDYVTKVFQEHPQVDVVYGDYTWIDESGRILQIRREIEFSYFILLYHRVPYIASTAAFFRRCVFDEGSRLDDRLQYAMDYEFFLRLATHGYRFLHVPAVLADFRFQRASKTCTVPHKQLEEIDRIAQFYSPVLRRLHVRASRWVAVHLLRTCAATLRYSEKLVRGYYFNQFRLSTLNS